MEIYVQRTLGAMDAFDIWFVFNDQIKGKRQVATFVPQEIGPARLEWQDADPAQQTEPTLRLSGYEAQSLKRGLDAHGPTTADGLALASDAIKTRDRLLSLVETLATSGLAVLPEVRR